MGYSESKKQGFGAFIREIAVLLLIVFLIRTFGFGLYQVPTGSMETTMLVGERFFADKFTPLFLKIKRGDIIAFNDPTFPYSSNKFKRLFEEYVWGPSNWTKRVIGAPGDAVKGVIEDGKPVVYLNGKKLHEPYINKYPLIKVCKVPFLEFKRRRAGFGMSNRDIGNLIVLKSYDKNATYDEQPFYNIKETHICFQEGGKLDLIYPGTARGGFMKNNVGKNYWGGNSDEFYVKLGKNQYWVMGDNRLGSSDSRFFGPLDGRLIHGKIIFRIWSIDSDASFWPLDLVKHPIDFWKRIRWNRCLQTVK